MTTEKPTKPISLLDRIDMKDDDLVLVFKDLPTLGILSFIDFPQPVYVPVPIP